MQTQSSPQPCRGEQTSHAHRLVTRHDAVESTGGGNRRARIDCVFARKVRRAGAEHTLELAKCDERARHGDGTQCRAGPRRGAVHRIARGVQLSIAERNAGASKAGNRRDRGGSSHERVRESNRLRELGGTDATRVRGAESRAASEHSSHLCERTRIGS